MMPGKPVAARGKRFSPAELEAARRVRLADVIADDLVVLFCGANPGLSSAAARAPFATPGDRWWPALYESGFTPRRLAPHEAHELLALGLGLTSLVRRPTVGVAELAQAEFVEGGRLLRRRVLARRPRWLAVLGVRRTAPPSVGRTWQSVSRRTRSGRRGSGYCPIRAASTRTILPGRSPPSSPGCGWPRVSPTGRGG